jgi:hypothetical protein
MKRRSLILVAALTLLVTGVVLAASARMHRLDAGSVHNRHPFGEDRAVGLRLGRPTHWRAFLLQH